jgi:putative oxidoreductase
MKAWSLLLLRFSTGMVLVLWGIVRLGSSETAQGLSDKYYWGLLNGDTIYTVLGAIEVAFGFLIILGLWRKVIYPLQALVYAVGLLAIMPYILDPFARYLVVGADHSILFFPSTTLFFATLVMLAFKDEDVLSLDARREKAATS